MTERVSRAADFTRRRLIEAGLARFARHGFDGASVRAIAEDAQANQAAIKYHFGNKDGLLLALLARDAATEMTNLDYLMAQPISAAAKLKLHIAGIMKAYQQFPYMNRLIHYLLHGSNTEAADEVSKFFVGPLLDFHRRLLAEGYESGEFRKIDPVLFYTSLIGACDNLFFSRHAMSRAIGVGPVTDEVSREYVAHLEAMMLGGIRTNNKKAGSTA